MLRKIKDYYRTDVVYKRKDIDYFIHDLKQIKIFIEKQYLEQVKLLINELSNEQIVRIHIAGD
jgi:hypothetical protein